MIDYIKYPPKLKLENLSNCLFLRIVFAELGNEVTDDEGVTYNGRFIIMDTPKQTVTDRVTYDFIDINGSKKKKINGSYITMSYNMYATELGFALLERILSKNKYEEWKLTFTESIGDDVTLPLYYEVRASLSNIKDVSNMDYASNQRIFDGKTFTLTIESIEPITDLFYAQINGKWGRNDPYNSLPISQQDKWGRTATGKWGRTIPEV